MIYWGEDSELENCKFYAHSRFKPPRRGSGARVNVPLKKMFYFPLTPRLQRLYAFNATTTHTR